MRDAANPASLNVFLNSVTPVLTVQISVPQQINVYGLGGNDTAERGDDWSKKAKTAERFREAMSCFHRSISLVTLDFYDPFALTAARRALM